MRRPRLTKRRAVVVAIVIVALLAGPAMFVINGLVMANGETPIAGRTRHPARAAALDERAQLKVLAYNVARGWAYKGGISFEDASYVEERLRAMAEVINAEQPDLVFLSEVLLECGPAPVNQVETLAEATGMHAWVFGENYNFGLPFYRIVSGNAVLSRWPLEPVANPSLPGRKPFFITKNNRRVLWCAADIGGRRTLLASIHNDSFFEESNTQQMRSILAFMGDQPALLAGDFNARPSDGAMRLVRESGRFVGVIDGAGTVPVDEPEKRIDYILAPRDWELIEERVIPSGASDHRPVVSTFRVK